MNQNIKINTHKKTNQISPLLYGIFFEDINYAGDGGLYAELVANRSFEYYDRDGKCDKHKMCWETIGNAALEVKSDHPLNDVHTHYACLSGKKGSGLRNMGYCREGFAVKDGEHFFFSCYAKSDTAAALTIKIADSHGEYARVKNIILNNTWTKLEQEITVNGTCKHAFLEILLEEETSICLEFVSLFPKKTFCNRRNGLRQDLAEMLKELQPKFMRFPGGCIVEGRSFENMYCWKDTIGPVEKRKTNWNRWQMEEYQQEGRNSEDYFQSYGLGFYEYFLLCEDLGAKPVPVVNAGMTCQWHEGLLVPMEQLEQWILDVLDLIEFANGDETTEWGKKRIEMGHKEPFHLEYIGIGNEQWGDVYFERYEAFEKAISERYPDIKLVTCAGWTVHGEDYDLAVEWMKQNRNRAYAVDEHFYKEPEWFFTNVDRYDDFDRTMPKIFAGEYAAHTGNEIGDRKNNWYAALSEAAFLTGVEKNADHVVMTCYAPLFGRLGHQQWQPNLIWFDNDSVFGTPSYYVQKLFSSHIGDHGVETLCEDNEIKISASVAADNGRLFVKIVNISNQEKDISIRIDRATAQCIVFELYGEPDAENNMENPKRIYPVSYEMQMDEIKKLKKYSVTVLDIELNENEILENKDCKRICEKN